MNGTYDCCDWHKIGERFLWSILSPLRTSQNLTIHKTLNSQCSIQFVRILWLPLKCDLCVCECGFLCVFFMTSYHLNERQMMWVLNHFYSSRRLQNANKYVRLFCCFNNILLKFAHKRNVMECLFEHVISKWLITTNNFWPCNSHLYRSVARPLNDSFTIYSCSIFRVETLYGPFW